MIHLPFGTIVVFYVIGTCSWGTMANAHSYLRLFRIHRHRIRTKCRRHCCRYCYLRCVSPTSFVLDELYS